MVNNLPGGRANRSIISAIANNTAQPFREPYVAGWLIIGGMVGLMVVMWGINLMGGLSLNLMLLLVGSIGFWFFAIAPIVHAYGLGIAGAWSIISLQSPRAGISDTLSRLYRLEMIVYFVFLVSGILLSTIYFFPNPFSFWALAFIAGALILLGKIFHIPPTGLEWKIIAGLLALCAFSWIFNVSIAMPSSQDNNAVAAVTEIGNLKPANWLSWPALIMVALGVALLLWLLGKGSGVLPSVKSLIGLAIIGAVAYAAYTYWPFSNNTDNNRPVEIVVQPEGSTVPVPKGQQVMLNLSAIPVTSQRGDMGLRCELDMSQSPALVMNSDGSPKDEGEYMNMTPVKRVGDTLYTSLVSMPNTYPAGVDTINVFCTDADPRS